MFVTTPIRKRLLWLPDPTFATPAQSAAPRAYREESLPCRSACCVEQFNEIFVSTPMRPAYARREGRLFCPTASHCGGGGKGTSGTGGRRRAVRGIRFGL